MLISVCVNLDNEQFSQYKICEYKEICDLYLDWNSVPVYPGCPSTRLHMVIHGFVFESYKTGIWTPSASLADTSQPYFFLSYQIDCNLNLLNTNKRVISKKLVTVFAD